MILCPNCNHQEETGALFCCECGAQLVTADPYKTQAINREAQDQMPLSQDESTSLDPPIPASGIDAVVSLHLMDSGQILHLAGQNKFTLGRVLEGQPILPDVDLSPFDAYAQGVSRIHAALKISNKQVFIVDLGSSNGTRVNGQKISANTDFPINHGDIVALGKLKIQVLIRR